MAVENNRNFNTPGWGIEIYGDFTEKRTGYDIGMVMLRGKTKSGEDTMTEYDMLGDHIVDFYYM